jgi:hypothetical protein
VTILGDFGSFLIAEIGSPKIWDTFFTGKYKYLYKFEKMFWAIFSHSSGLTASEE